MTGRADEPSRKTCPFWEVRKRNNISVNNERDNELKTLITQTDAFSEEQIEDLRKYTVSMGNVGTDCRDRAQFRAAIETIAAIKQFDTASAKLIDTTNRLTRWILALTILAVLFAGASLYLSWLALMK